MPSCPPPPLPRAGADPHSYLHTQGTCKCLIQTNVDEQPALPFSIEFQTPPPLQAVRGGGRVCAGPVAVFPKPGLGTGGGGVEGGGTPGHGPAAAPPRDQQPVAARSAAYLCGIQARGLCKGQSFQHLPLPPSYPYTKVQVRFRPL